MTSDSRHPRRGTTRSRSGRGIGPHERACWPRVSKGSVRTPPCCRLL